jgi:hypothetical protein
MVPLFFTIRKPSGNLLHRSWGWSRRWYSEPAASAAPGMALSFVRCRVGRWNFRHNRITGLAFEIPSGSPRAYPRRGGATAIPPAKTSGLRRRRWRRRDLPQPGGIENQSKRSDIARAVRDCAGCDRKRREGHLPCVRPKLSWSKLKLKQPLA